MSEENEVIEEEDIDEEETTDEIEEADTNEDTEEDAEETEEEKKPVILEPEVSFEYDKCSITIGITLMPTRENETDRRVAISVRNDDDMPIVKVALLSTITFPSVIQDTLDELLQDLPNRKIAYEIRKKKKNKRKKDTTPKAATQTVKGVGKVVTAVNEKDKDAPAVGQIGLF